MRFCIGLALSLSALGAPVGAAPTPSGLFDELVRGLRPGAQPLTFAPRKLTRFASARPIGVALADANGDGQLELYWSTGRRVHRLSWQAGNWVHGEVAHSGLAVRRGLLPSVWFDELAQPLQAYSSWFAMPQAVASGSTSVAGRAPSVGAPVVGCAAGFDVVANSAPPLPRDGRGWVSGQAVVATRRCLWHQGRLVVVESGFDDRLHITGAGQHAVMSGVGTMWQVVDADRDGVLEVWASAAGPIEAPDAIEVRTVEAKPRLVWRYALPAPIVGLWVADVNGDQQVHAYVATWDGAGVELWSVTP